MLNYKQIWHEIKPTSWLIKFNLTYPTGVEHAGMIKKGRDRDRRDQGQPELRASPEKVKNEVMKIKGASHPEKFEARAPDRHYRNCILFLFIRLAHKSTFVCFLFLFLSDSKIVSYSLVFCKW